MRSRVEYCSVVFHNSPTQAQDKKIEKIQKTSSKIILQDQYIGSEAACQLTGLSSLAQRRQSRYLTFPRHALSRAPTAYLAICLDLKIGGIKNKAKKQTKQKYCHLDKGSHWRFGDYSNNIFDF